MMDFITVPLTCAIIFSTIYGLFELFARRKERLAIIEKMGDNFNPEVYKGKMILPTYKIKCSFGSLKTGCLLCGIGLGLLLGYFLNMMGPEYGNWHRYNEIHGVVYGASVLLCGGISLIIAFVIEMKMSEKDKQ